MISRNLIAMTAAFTGITAAGAGLAYHRDAGGLSVASPATTAEIGGQSGALEAAQEASPQTGAGIEPSWGVGTVAGVCNVFIRGAYVMSGACAGDSRPNEIVLTAESGGCTVELNRRKLGATVKLYSYRDTCWIDETAGQSVDRDLPLGQIKREGDCWRNNVAELCFMSTKPRQSADPSQTDRTSRLTFEYLAGEWEDAQSPSCGTPYVLRYFPEGRWEQDGQGSRMRIVGDKLHFDTDEGASFETIQVVDRDRYRTRGANEQSWREMRRCRS